MNKKSGLSLTIIFKAESANYGEGYSNLATLKKITRSDSNEYTYISRQSLRYNIIEQLGWDKTPVSQEAKGVVQFSPDATIKDYPEIDLFGYMKTTKAKSEEDSKGTSNTRSAVARLSNAISLSPYYGDSDFLNNMGLAKRKDFDNSLAQTEIHSSYYKYTINIDLDKVGIDKDIEITNSEKANRVNSLLTTIRFLYKDIRGRRENLSPLFIIGGLYERKNPFFEHVVDVKNNQIKIAPIESVLENVDIKNNTYIGVINDIFDNDIDLKEKLNATSIDKVFEVLEREVNEYYN